jgi:hypothetical protein
MKKLLSIPIIAAMLSFTMEHGAKIASGTIIANELTNEVNAQSRNLTLDDTTLFKPARYIPNMQTFGFNIGFDGSGIFYPAARPDYRFDIDVLPTLASVAFTGSYYDISYAPDLNNLPLYWHKFESDTLYQSSHWRPDWNVSGNILNKPTITTYTASYGITNTSGVLKVDTTAIMYNTKASAAITTMTNNIALKANKATELTINSVMYDLSTNRSWTIAADQTVVLAGTNGITTSGTYPSFTISKKRQETYTGTTNSSGVVTFTFTAFSVAPNIQYNPGFGATNKETCIPNAAVTTTSCSFYIQLRSDVIGLLPTYANVNGREVNIVVTEK